jgi:hypothetical protein
MKNFNYIVATTWPAPNQDQLRIYTYFSQVQYGNTRSANKFLAYVQRQEPTETWQIIRIPLPTTKA